MLVLNLKQHLNPKPYISPNQLALHEVQRRQDALTAVSNATQTCFHVARQDAFFLLVLKGEWIYVYGLGLRGSGATIIGHTWIRRDDCKDPIPRSPLSTSKFCVLSLLSTLPCPV